MELRALGQTGLRISRIGLGTTKLGRNEQVKYPRPFELPTDAQVLELFAMAQRLGINLIDTAPAYGSSEQKIGALLPRPDDWVIATKVGESFDRGHSRFDFSAEALRASVARSAHLLRRERLDLVLLHCGDDDLRVLRDSGAVDSLRALQREGRIGAIGASTKSVEAGLLAVSLCDVVMVSFSRADRTQRPVIEAARKAGKGVLVKKPLDSGHDDAPALALAAVLAEPGVDAAIVGTIDAGHLQENCAALAGTDRS